MARALLKRSTATPTVKYLHSGSTQINLACTGRTNAAYKTGRFYYYVGDTSSGKTFLTLTCLAEAAINPEFDDYQLIHDDVENGAGFDFVKFFGQRMKDRVQPPAGTPEEPTYSKTVEDFYDYLNTALDRGPCIYILDSMDGLKPRAEIAKYEKQKKVRERQRTGDTIKDEAGSYGVEKARLNSQHLGLVMSKLRETNSLLFIISQTRVNLMSMGYGDKKTRSGGDALTFYCSLSLWSSVKEHIKKETNINGVKKMREQGIISKVRVKKNRETGKDRAVEVPIYHSFGIDDTGSCIDYLLGEGWWKKSKGVINAKELGQQMKKDELIAHVQEKPARERLLRKTVKTCWNTIEKAVTITRKSRYTEDAGNG